MGLVTTSVSRARILVVDDLAANVALVKRFLASEDFRISACSDSTQVVDLIHRDPPDAVVMDVRMPAVDGFTLCRALKDDPKTRLIPVVLMTAASFPQDRLDAIEAGADDFVAKPLRREELLARLRSLVRMKRFTDDLDHAEHVIVSLALTIEARDQYTNGHCQRLAAYAVSVGQALGLADDDLAALKRGAYLHDIGKIAVPDRILLKEGALTPAEVSIMRQHTLVGERLCGELRSLRLVRPIIRHHHEKLDGSGYPDRLRDGAIPLTAEIVGLVDVFDALTTDRPYREALPREAALDELRHEVRRGWRRRDLLDTFTEQLSRMPS